MLLEKTSSTVDNSPANSPIVRSHRPATSPLRRESSFPNNGSNAQAALHPLPPPPGSNMPSQPAISTVAAKNEFIPINSLWQKGKILGHGTFGCVYVASNRYTNSIYNYFFPRFHLVVETIYLLLSTERQGLYVP